KGLIGRGVDEPAYSFLANPAATNGLRILHGRRRWAAERVVESVRRVRILGEPDIASRSAQSFYIGLAGGHRVVVIGCSMKDPDRPIGKLGVGRVGRHAIRVERNVRGEFDSGFVP